MSPSRVPRRESVLSRQDRHLPARSRFVLPHRLWKRFCRALSPHRIFATIPWLDTREYSSFKRGADRAISLRYASRQRFFFNHRRLARGIFEHFVRGARATLVPFHRRGATFCFSFPP